MAGFIQEYAKIIIAAVIGTFGYSQLFGVKRNKLAYACLGGALSITVYFGCVYTGLSLLMQSMIPAVAATLYAELMARYAKAPATVFLMTGVIPLTPGSRLYYTMRAIVDGNRQQANEYGRETLIIALGIALGIVLVSLIFHQISHRKLIYRIRFDESERNG
ncbi:MAG: threonine/serine exporter family protein [Roseburia sp.]|nr:threonine/serine exporter family protein [Roseburia sp.]